MIKILPKHSSFKGFTLIELLVVIGILTVLLGIALVAINPARQFSQANDTQRRSDVNAILNAVHQYAADHNGVLPGAISTSVKEVATPGADICQNIVPTYIAQVPADPVSGSYVDCTNYRSGYTIVKTSVGRITVAAPGAELGTINVTR